MEPIELVKDRLYLLGGTVPIQGDLTWRDPSHDGRHESFNAFLLVEDEETLLIETGAACHRDLVRAQLDAVLGRDRHPVGVVGTRLEPDCLSNLPSLAAAAEAGDHRLTVYAAAGMNILDFFEDLSAEELIRQYGVEVRLLRAGLRIELGPDRAVEVLRPSLRTLSTAWLYDEATKALFCSDAFSHYSGGTAATRLAEEVQDELGPDWLNDGVGRHLTRKWDWLPLANLELQIAEMEELFGSRRVEILGPTRGCPIRGAALVADNVQVLLGHLRRLEAEQSQIDVWSRS